MFPNLVFQLVTILNFFSNIYIFFLLFIFGYLEIVSEGFVVLALVMIFTQGFSANMRNIYLGSNTLNLKRIILFRVLISIVCFILATILTYIFIGKSHILFHTSVIFLTTTNWILELFIAKNEKDKFINTYYFTNFFFFYYFQ